VTALVQLRTKSPGVELVMASKTHLCLKMLDMLGREVKPYSKADLNAREINSLAVQAPKLEEQLEETHFNGPSGQYEARCEEG